MGEYEPHPEGRNEMLSHIKELLDIIKSLGSDPRKSDEILRNAQEAKRIFNELNPTDEEVQQLTGFKDNRALRSEIWSWLE